MECVKQSEYCMLDENSPKLEEGCLEEDLRKVNLKELYLVDKPKHPEKFYEMKKSTPARIGIGHAGPRYKTETMLRFRADHSAAQDSVFSYVSEEFIEKCGYFTVETLCKDREEFVTRPDKGRIINDEGIEIIKERCIMNPTVQIIVADGLSAAAIEANSRDTLLALQQGLDKYGIDYGTTFFIKNSRVATEDIVCELVNADVICQLIGERPGLVSSESMSAYIAYKAVPHMNESRRTVVSNIHMGGTIPVEAGSHMADIIKLMLEKKCSGTELKM